MLLRVKKSKNSPGPEVLIDPTDVCGDGRSRSAEDPLLIDEMSDVAALNRQTSLRPIQQLGKWKQTEK